MQWQEISKGRVQLLNEYGPTEATVVATIHEVTGTGLGAEPREVPIGSRSPMCRHTPRSRLESGTDWRPRRAVRRRGRCGQRLSPSSGSDSREFYTKSLQSEAGRATLPHG
jgi:hypothetical protein